MYLALTLFFLISPALSFSLKYRRNAEMTSCPQEILKCENPLPHERTKQFECEHDKMCPTEYKCCQDSCFQHNICKKNEGGVQQEYCPIDEKLCSVPLDYTQTQQFLCYTNSQCPQEYLCCMDSCFWHKVCKKSVVTLDDNVIVPFIVADGEEIGNSTSDDNREPEKREGDGTVSFENLSATENNKTTEKETIVENDSDNNKSKEELEENVSKVIVPENYEDYYDVTNDTETNSE